MNFIYVYFIHNILTILLVTVNACLNLLDSDSITSKNVFNFNFDFLIIRFLVQLSLQVMITANIFI